MHSEAGGFMALLNGGAYTGAATVRGLLAAPNEDVWHAIEAYLKPDI